jgi:hypothetical protein
VRVSAHDDKRLKKLRLEHGFRLFAPPQTI